MTEENNNQLVLTNNNIEKVKPDYCPQDEYILRKKLFLKQTNIRGPNAYFPVTFHAEILRDDYHLSPFEKNIDKSVEGLGAATDWIYDDDPTAMDEIHKKDKERPDLHSRLAFMNETYEKMPWYEKVRYNGEELTERVLNINLKLKVPKKDWKFNRMEMNANNFLLENIWKEKENEIYWKLKQVSHPEKSGDTTNYNIIIQTTDKESELLTKFAKDKLVIVADFELGDKIEVRRTTINDHYD